MPGCAGDKHNKQASSITELVKRPARKIAPLSGEAARVLNCLALISVSVMTLETSPQLKDVTYMRTIMNLTQAQKMNEYISVVNFYTERFDAFK